ADDVWESSRFALDVPETAQKGARGLAVGTYELFAGMIEFGLAKRLKEIVTVTDTRISLAGGLSSGGKAFHGSRIGRGSGVGRVLASRDQYASFRTRRVVVKSRIVKFTASGVKAARLHLSYIQRDGVTREGEPGELYDAQHDRADGKEFLER